MLSSHSTASKISLILYGIEYIHSGHLKITLRFLLSMIQQNEFTARLIFSAIDFKRPCWKPLLRRRDIRDTDDVRSSLIKLFLSPLIYRNIDLIRNLIKEHGKHLLPRASQTISHLDIFHEIFSGLINDSRSTVEYFLEEIRTNVSMQNLH